jgi:hypothetical protein
VRKGISKRQRFDVLARCGFACVYCGRRPPEVILHVDHGLPVAHGGMNNDENLVAACRDCNYGKHARIYATAGVPFRKWLRAQVGRDDMIGDLADDEKRTPIDRDPKTHKELVKLINGKKIGGVNRDVARAIWHAWREFRRGGRLTRIIAELYEERDKYLRAGGTEHFKAGIAIRGVFWPYDGGHPTWIADGEPPEWLKLELKKKLKRGRMPWK